MQSEAKTPEEYIAAATADRREKLAEIRDVISANIPDGFDEVMSYGHLGWVVPHEVYPPGYHCDPKLPLPFLGVASQKNFIAIYHMGIYADPLLLAWFQDEWGKATPRRLDMGKSCIRFTKPANVPVKLIGELAAKISAEEWIQIYEKSLKR